jgi:hypothetical protein
MPFLLAGAIGGGLAAGAGLLGAGIGVVGGAVLGGLAGASIDARVQQQNQLRQAAAADERAFRLQQQQADIQQTRTSRAAFRQSVLARAAMANVAYQTGGAGSSALAGGMGSVQSQTGSRIGAMQQTAAMNTKIGQQTLQGAQARTSAATYGAIGDITQTIFGNIGGYTAAGKLMTA